MAKYHVNPETGKAGACSATFKCPFGDLEKEHFPSAAEARKSFEKRMETAQEAAKAESDRKASRRLGAPIVTPSNGLHVPGSDARYGLDYDTEEHYDHSQDSDMCRCRTITGVTIKGWENDGEGLSDFAKSQLGLPWNEPLPQDLKEKLQPFADNFRSDDFDYEVSGGYYGEELQSISAPKELVAVLDDYYYGKSDAAGPENILGYLRGKGYDTTGERPLAAIKGALQAENKGRKSEKVENAKKWRTSSIGINNIVLPSASQAEAGEKDPRPLQQPVGAKKSSRELYAGVVVQRKDGTFELVDGYHRLADLKANNKRRAKYLILSAEPPVERSPYYWQREAHNWYSD